MREAVKVPGVRRVHDYGKRQRIIQGLNTTSTKSTKFYFCTGRRKRAYNGEVRGSAGGGGRKKRRD